jgi:hypothetical protein
MTDTWDLQSRIEGWKFRCEFCNGEIPKGRWHDACLEKALKIWREEE